MKDLNQYIPLDKSWLIRMGVLDIIHHRNQITEFLENQSKLNADLKALARAAKEWGTAKQISVGESGTLYRFLQFASWKLQVDKQFKKEGTLQTRVITQKPEIVHWSQTQLLGLDNQTSQWASAAVLLGDKERLSNPPFKLQVTYEAVEHWKACIQRGGSWEQRYDTTIEKQAQAFIGWYLTNDMKFQPEQAEDYCFARAFKIITPKEGEKAWPSLAGHESNRLMEMETAISEAEQNQPITSRDHRVIQAIALKYHTKHLSYAHPEAVSKSWPQFWNFLHAVKQTSNT